MTMPYGIFRCLASEIPRQQAVEDLRALTVAQTNDPKDLANRLRAAAYSRNSPYGLKGKKLASNWRSLIGTAGKSR